MNKQAVHLSALLLLGTLAFGQTEEMRQDKLEVQHARTRQLEAPKVAEPGTSFEEEMSLLKREVHSFRAAQQRNPRVAPEQTERVVSPAAASESAASEGAVGERLAREEMRLIKQDYRTFSSAHKRRKAVTAETEP